MIEPHPDCKAPHVDQQGNTYIGPTHTCAGPDCPAKDCPNRKEPAPDGAPVPRR